MVGESPADFKMRSKWTIFMEIILGLTKLVGNILGASLAQFTLNTCQVKSTC